MGWKYRGKKVGLDDLVRDGASGSKLQRIENLREKYGNDLAIQYDEFAQPNFDQLSLADVSGLAGLDGTKLDASKAWAQLYKQDPELYASARRLVDDGVELNWHHAGEGRLQLLDADINLTFPHTGEAAFLRRGFGGEALSLIAPTMIDALEQGKSSGETGWAGFIDFLGFADPTMVFSGLAKMFTVDLPNVVEDATNPDAPSLEINDSHKGGERSLREKVNIYREAMR